MKTYQALCGLPRSGNTLLSALLNQNPETYSSPLSPMAEILYRNASVFNLEEFVRTKELVHNQHNVLHKLFDEFYYNVQKPVIFDRSKNWGVPANFELLKRYVNPKVKVLITVRNVVDILASLVAQDIATYREQIYRVQPAALSFLDYNDLLCDFLMSPTGDMSRYLMQVKTAILPENKNHFFIIEYEDLVSKPDEVMKNVYEFLELKPYNHNFDLIEKLEFDDDLAVNHPGNLHKVSRTITPSKTNAKETLSEYTYNKYKGADFWRTGRL
jgi:sulfotransferase